MCISAGEAPDTLLQWMLSAWCSAIVHLCHFILNVDDVNSHSMHLMEAKR